MGPDGGLPQCRAVRTVTGHAPRSPAQRDLLVAVVALALLLCWEASGLDLMLAGWYGGATGFAAREAWWSKHLLHDGGRWLAAMALLAFTVHAWIGGAGQPLGQLLLGNALHPMSRHHMTNFMA